MGGSTGVANAKQPNSSSSSPSHIPSRSGRVNKSRIYKSGAADSHHYWGTSVNWVNCASVASQRHSHTAEMETNVLRSAPLNPPLLSGRCVDSAPDLCPQVSADGPPRNRQAFRSAPLQRRAFLPETAVSQRTVDTGTEGEGNISTYARVREAPAAPTSETPHRPFNFAPFCTRKNSMAEPSAGSGAELPSTVASVNQTSDDGYDYVCGASPSSDDVDDVRAGLSSSHPDRVKCNNPRHRRKKTSNILIDAGPSGNSHGTAQPQDVSANPQSSPRPQFTTSTCNMISSSAHRGTSRRSGNSFHMALVSSPREPGTEDSAAAFDSTTTACAVEMCDCSVKPLPYNSRTSPENHTQRVSTNTFTMPTLHRAYHGAVPSVRIFYTRSASHSTEGSPEKPTCLGVRTAASAPTGCTAADSTRCATRRDEMEEALHQQSVACPTACLMKTSLSEVLRHRRSTPDQQRRKQKPRQLSPKVLLTRNAITASVCPREAPSALHFLHEGRGELACHKSGCITTKDVVDAADGELQPTIARSSPAPPQSCLKRWRQRQQKKATLSTAVASDSASTSPNIEIVAVVEGAPVTQQVKAASNVDTMPSLASASATGASCRYRKIGRQALVSAGDSTEGDIAIAPQPKTEESNEHHTPPLTENVNNTLTPSTSSDCVFGSEVEKNETVKRSIATVAPGSLRSQCRSDLSSTPQLHPLPTPHTQREIDSPSAGSTCPSPKQASPIVIPSEDLVDQAGPKQSMPVNLTRQSSLSPMGMPQTKPTPFLPKLDEGIASQGHPFPIYPSIPGLPEHHITQESVTTAKGTTSSSLSVVSAKGREPPRAIRERRRKRSPGVVSPHTADGVSPQPKTLADAYGTMPSGNAEALRPSSPAHPPIPRDIAVTDTPPASTRDLAPNKGGSSPPTAEATAENLIDPRHLSHLGSRDSPVSASTTETTVKGTREHLIPAKRSYAARVVRPDSIGRPHDGCFSHAESTRLGTIQPSCLPSVPRTCFASVTVLTELDTTHLTCGGEQVLLQAKPHHLLHKLQLTSNHTGDTEVSNKETRIPDADAQGRSLKSSSSFIPGALCVSLRNRSLRIHSGVLPLMEKKTFEGDRRSTSAHRPGQQTVDARSTPEEEAAPPPHSPPSLIASLSYTPLSDLDKLEQSVDALLEKYRHKRDVTSDGTPAPPTSADSHPCAMPVPDNVVRNTKEGNRVGGKDVNLRRKTHKWCSRSTGNESPHLSSCPGGQSDTDEDENRSQQSQLWCGDEAMCEIKPPPVYVPPLDLAQLLPPTGSVDDLQQYRIPLPSAVPDPAEAYQRLLRIISAYSAPVEEEERIIVAAEDNFNTDSTSQKRSKSPLMTTAAHCAKPIHTSASLNGSRDPVSGPKISRSTRHQDHPSNPNSQSEQIPTSRQLSLSSLTSSADVQLKSISLGSGNCMELKPDQATAQQTAVGHTVCLDEAVSDPPLEKKSKPLIGEATGSLHPSATRMVPLADNSHCSVKTNRHSQHFRRVKRQRTRIQCILLGCEERHKRQEILLEESNFFDKLILP